MKYGYYEVNESPSSIEDYTDGAHIIVLRKVTDFFKNTCILEDIGWSVRDSIKVITKTESFNATLFRKPFKGTVANNVLNNGCGGINIDASRIKTNGEQPKGSGNGQKNTITHGDRNDLKGGSITPPEGRFPANLLLECTCENDTVATHTDSNCPCKKLDVQSGISKSTGGSIGTATGYGNNFAGSRKNVKGNGGLGDVGGASRFFFSFKSKDELKEYLVALIRC